jgi:hypothetical protein
MPGEHNSVVVGSYRFKSGEHYIHLKGVMGVMPGKHDLAATGLWRSICGDDNPPPPPGRGVVVVQVWRA